MTCNTQVTINNAVGWCDICENAESQSECKLKTDVKIVILDESDQMKYYISVPHSLIEKSINVCFKYIEKGNCHETCKQNF